MVGMNNAQIADAFDLIADLLEIQGANAFRVRAYRRGARVVREWPEALARVASDEPGRLTTIEGIGRDLADKIVSLSTTGSVPLLEELRAQVPSSVLELMRIPSLGPKKAAILHRELGINTLDDLRAACQAHRLRELKGFGAKTEETIAAGIELAASANERIYWAKADEYAKDLIEHLSSVSTIERITLAGSYRRGRDTVADLDILAVAAEATAAMDRLGEFAGAEVIGRGGTKMSVRLSDGLQVDLRVVPAESFGAALQYFTGSKEHNVVLRGLAKNRGLKINEYGLFQVTPEGEVYLAGRTEEEIYASLDLPTFPPEIREARFEFAWAAAGPLPRLVELADLRGDLHMHTTATDGRATLEEMVAAARQRGFAYIAITDHSKRVSMANGLDEPRLLAQWAEIDRMNATLTDLRILKGVEVDILERGGLDLADDCLCQADWVVASVHYGQNQPREQITARIIGALENPNVSAIAHPTGRLINRRAPYEVDLEAVFKAAAAHGKCLELNANPARLDLDDLASAAAKAHGIPIVISSDSHSAEGFDVLRYGILQARRAGLRPEDVLNTRAWPDIQKLLGRV
jgi:DNA polymerase (family X)